MFICMCSVYIYIYMCVFVLLYLHLLSFMETQCLSVCKYLKIIYFYIKNIQKNH